MCWSEDPSDSEINWSDGQQVEMRNSSYSQYKDLKTEKMERLY